MTSTHTKLQVRNLEKHFQQNDDLLSRLMGDTQMVKAVDGVSFEIKQGEAFGVAGESGCGKSTLGRTVLRLHEATDGEVVFDGQKLHSLESQELNRFRKNAQIIYQDPYQSLNPRFKIRQWIREPLDIHDIGKREERDEIVRKTLEEVGLRPAETYLDEYPGALSGGQRQRVCIARAVVSDPDFIVCDEPVSMLDVSIRAEILELLNRLQAERDMSALFISHDLSLLKHMCDRLAIMYLGKIVEIGPARDVIDNPQHPYTEALVSSTPIIDPDTTRDRIPMEGSVPDPVNIPSGCRFAPRCRKAMEACTEEEPPMYTVNEQQSRCIIHDDAIDPDTEPPLRH